MVMYLGRKTTGSELIEIRVLILRLEDKADFQEDGIVTGRILSSPSLENVGPISIAHGKATGLYYLYEKIQGSRGQDSSLLYIGMGNKRGERGVLVGWTKLL